MSDDRPTAERVGVFYYKCKRGHWVLSNNPDLGVCEWPGCGVPYDDDDECWVEPFEYLRVKAEVERLCVADKALRTFAETVIAMTVPMDPPADNPIPPVIAKVLHGLAAAALQEPQ
jgi:hypothetical protein